MKTYHLRLSLEDQKKLVEVLKHLKQRDLQSYMLSYSISSG